MTAPTEAERAAAALAWLDEALAPSERYCFTKPLSDVHRATIKAMLDEPRLPKEPPPEALEAIVARLRETGSYIDAGKVAYEAYSALFNHFHQPKVKAWRVVTHLPDDTTRQHLVFIIESEMTAHVLSMLATGHLVSIEQIEVPA